MIAKTALAAAAALVALGFAATHAGPATAADADAPSATIHVADLDLSTEAGAKIALQRIRFAARAICGEEPSSHRLADVRVFDECVTATTNQAVASLHAPLVTALAGVPSPGAGAT